MVFWIRVLAIAQIALLARRHLTKLEPEERSTLARLVAKSKGRPKRNLDAGERGELLRLARKLEPGAFAAGGWAAVRHPTKFPPRT